MGAVVGALLGTVGSVFTGLMGFKTKQADVVQSSLGVLKELVKSDGEVAQSLAGLYAADSVSESWLTRNWRALLIITMFGMFCSWWFFGYVPPYFNTPMSPMMERFWSSFEVLTGIGLGGGYAKDIVKSLTQGGVVKEFIKKTVV